ISSSSSSSSSDTIPTLLSSSSSGNLDLEISLISSTGIVPPTNNQENIDLSSAIDLPDLSSAIDLPSLSSAPGNDPLTPSSSSSSTGGHGGEAPVRRCSNERSEFIIDGQNWCVCNRGFGGTGCREPFSYDEDCLSKQQQPR